MIDMTLDETVDAISKLSYHDIFKPEFDVAIKSAERYLKEYQEEKRRTEHERLLDALLSVHDRKGKGQGYIPYGYSPDKNGKITESE
mgnify:CR=1 FL=1